ncbi:hypothetical protein [Devosia naphthalenivorans]|uniref:hypothetical protein n=1 Tax=Devosia naphthalenivorans TaxID=2082392 RepID=UPI000D3AD025|nr:hypothetical protein [Devosia naphthalenivorans]
MLRPRDSKKPFANSVGSSASENPDTQPPIFSFEKMQDGSGYSVNCCERDDQAALAKRLFLLSQMNWRDIRNAPRHGTGTETIARKSLKTKLPSSVTEDSTILALRFNGKKAMIGYRDARVFYVLLLDHDFSAYDH